MVSRIVTGISGFDELIQGGLPERSVILVSGSPGTGKTIFGFETLIRGCAKGDYGVFLSFEQSEADLLSQMSEFSWNVDKYLKNGKLIVKHLDLLEYNDIFEYLRKTIPKQGNVRLVIDSLTALQNYPALLHNADKLVAMSSDKSSVFSITEESVHRMLTHYFIGMVKSFPNVTTILTSDIPDESNKLSSDGISDYMADGIVVFYYLGMGGDNARNLQIRKMRWTRQQQGYFPYQITENGIEVSNEGKSVLMK